MFDIYSLKARVYPIIILFIPIIVIGFIYSLHFENIIHFASSAGVAGGLMYLLSQLGRDQGKIKEKELWESWGAPPSTLVLRLSDSTIDKHTKDRYHKTLQALCPINEPLIEDRNADSKGANDETYRAWTKFLISKTRDTKEYNLLFKENTSYGFRRNLWALKPFAISLLVVLIILNYFVAVKVYTSFNVTQFSDEFWYSSSTLFLFLFSWSIIITKDWVKIPAIEYALRLFEATDQIKP